MLASVFQNVIKTDVRASSKFLDSKTAKSNLKIVRNFDNDEPLLLEPQRLSFFPVVYQDVYDLYKKAKKAFWDVDEVDMTKDRSHFKALDSNTQHFIKNILGFFATADGTVALNISYNFIDDIKNFEIQIAYQFQVAMEGVHSEMYSIMIDEIVDNHEEKQQLFDAVKTVPCIEYKNAWAVKWAYSGAPFRQRLVANAIVEGIFFSGSFCAIFWIKEKNVMPGFTQSNELIARDERMHCDFACCIYDKIKHKMSNEEIYEMFDDAVKVEKAFINDSLRCDLIGMNPDLMGEYIEYVADVLLQNLGYAPLYKSQCPFEFMKKFNVQVKTNFFETRTTAYKRAGPITGKAVISDDF